MLNMEGVIFYLVDDSNGYNATMEVETVGDKKRFIVKSGSKVRIDPTDSFPKHSYYNYFVKNLHDVKDGVLDKDFTANSVSLASAIVLARASNGRTEWKDRDGKPIKDYLETEYMDTENETAWFVGSYMGGEDYTDEFIKQGYWKHGFDDGKYDNYFGQIEVGDKIAIKSAYNKKTNLPFDNNSKPVSVQMIKARGTITKIDEDNNTLIIDWDNNFKPKEWYFYTFRKTMWKVEASKRWHAKALCEFTFNDKLQDYDKFMNDPFWKGRYGASCEYNYDWIPFYTEFATKLLSYKDKRIELLTKVKSVYEKHSMKFPLTEKDENDKTIDLSDVCPFTIFGLFNKGLNRGNRIKIAQGIADSIGVSEKIQSEFEGIPVLNNMRSWFFGYTKQRKSDDIDNLWQLFEVAQMNSENSSGEYEEEFIMSFDKVSAQLGIKWNITFALYWIRPFDYLPLDSNTRGSLIALNIEEVTKFKHEICTGREYVDLIKKMNQKFIDDGFPVESFPELSYKAWSGDFVILTPPDDSDNPDEAELIEEKQYENYSLNDFLNEVFISKEEYNLMTSLLDRKKNLIIQGSPGVGKTFMAKRLAYSLLAQKKEENIQLVQFHQSYAYEDFIIGYRPTTLGGFELKTGPFFDFCTKARRNPSEKFFFIIDEINRGNLSKIFGELMMLIESDKRGQSLKLIYNDVEFSVPENVYIIGMMNTADRSLAIIDYALRRRFCFYGIEPAFNKQGFKEHLESKGATASMIEKIVHKLGSLNKKISDDINLGKGFRIGHSYFCDYRNSDKWYDEIINFEIIPLLEEYWFDEENLVSDCVKELLS